MNQQSNNIIGTAARGSVCSQDMSEDEEKRPRPVNHGATHLSIQKQRKSFNQDMHLPQRKFYNVSTDRKPQTTSRKTGSFRNDYNFDTLRGIKNLTSSEQISMVGGARRQDHYPQAKQNTSTSRLSKDRYPQEAAYNSATKTHRVNLGTVEQHYREYKSKSPVTIQPVLKMPAKPHEVSSRQPVKTDFSAPKFTHIEQPPSRQSSGTSDILKSRSVSPIAKQALTFGKPNLRKMMIADPADVSSESPTRLRVSSDDAPPYKQSQDFQSAARKIRLMKRQCEMFNESHSPPKTGRGQSKQGIDRHTFSSQIKTKDKVASLTRQVNSELTLPKVNHSSAFKSARNFNVDNDTSKSPIMLGQDFKRQCASVSVQTTEPQLQVSEAHLQEMVEIEANHQAELKSHKHLQDLQQKQSLDQLTAQQDLQLQQVKESHSQQLTTLQQDFKITLAKQLLEQRNTLKGEQNNQEIEVKSEQSLALQSLSNKFLKQIGDLTSNSEQTKREDKLQIESLNKQVAKLIKSEQDSKISSDLTLLQLRQSYQIERNNTQILQQQHASEVQLMSDAILRLKDTYTVQLSEVEGKREQASKVMHGALNNLEASVRVEQERSLGLEIKLRVKNEQFEVVSLQLQEVQQEVQSRVEQQSEVQSNKVLYLQNVNQDLTRQLFSKTDYISKLVSDHTSEVDTLRNTACQQQTQISLLQEQKQAVSSELACCQAEQVTQMERTNSKQIENESLLQFLKQSVQSLEQVQSDNLLLKNELTSQSEQAQEQLNNLKTTISTTQSEADHRDTHLQSLNYQLSQELSSNKEEFNLLLVQKEKDNHKIEEHSKDLQLLKAQNEDKLNQIASQSFELDQFSQKHQTLEEDNRCFQNKIEQFLQKVLQLQAENLELSKELSTTKTEISLQETERASTQQSLQFKVQETFKQISELESENKELKEGSQQNDFQKKVVYLQNVNRDLTKQLSHKTTALARATKDKQDIEERLTERTSELERSTQRSTQVTNELESRLSDVSERQSLKDTILGEELQQAYSQRQTLQGHNQDLEEAVDRVQMYLELAQDRAQQLQQEKLDLHKQLVAQTSAHDTSSFIARLVDRAEREANSLRVAELQEATRRQVSALAKNQSIKENTLLAKLKEALIHKASLLAHNQDTEKAMGRVIQTLNQVQNKADHLQKEKLDLQGQLNDYATRQATSSYIDTLVGEAEREATSLRVSELQEVTRRQFATLNERQSLKVSTLSEELKESREHMVSLKAKNQDLEEAIDRVKLFLKQAQDKADLQQYGRLELVEQLAAQVSSQATSSFINMLVDNAEREAYTLKVAELIEATRRNVSALMKKQSEKESTLSAQLQEALLQKESLFAQNYKLQELMDLGQLSMKKTQNSMDLLQQEKLDLEGQLSTQASANATTSYIDMLMGEAEREATEVLQEGTRHQVAEQEAYSDSTRSHISNLESRLLQAQASYDRVCRDLDATASQLRDQISLHDLQQKSVQSQLREERKNCQQAESLRIKVSLDLEQVTLECTQLKLAQQPETQSCSSTPCIDIEIESLKSTHRKQLIQIKSQVKLLKQQLKEFQFQVKSQKLQMPSEEQIYNKIQGRILSLVSKHATQVQQLKEQHATELDQCKAEVQQVNLKQTTGMVSKQEGVAFQEDKDLVIASMSQKINGLQLKTKELHTQNDKYKTSLKEREARIASFLHQDNALVNSLSRKIKDQDEQSKATIAALNQEIKTMQPSQLIASEAGDGVGKDLGADASSTLDEVKRRQISLINMYQIQLETQHKKIKGLHSQIK